MPSLDATEIQALLSKARSRGEYDAYLKEFLESGDAGRLIDRESGILAQKTTDQIKVGLENAKKRTNDSGQFVNPGAQMVKVIKKTEKDANGNVTRDDVYVIDTSKVEGTQESSPDSVPA